ncbi:glycosyl transferase [Candidatus Roizmanbacteria bacterium CG_4_10_14_0_8_um_filter_39_9]|uniref:Glycosyl transferase n=1 Tax=Candidatus Roizmanbacteria bacterium CG_4_10_14_0_8_um_filter_39_9 TaxID=1974829 RepID=A0A2M7QEB6_9BACT|nr:MAG: glycosyl transferase [Candidatus Roizmanbacteria bacterium CG_4_10_14_0_8_um_filter_39_9]
MRLSIIIPVYNEEKHIAQVIESVISANSLGMNKEIIVVDDGSTDNTASKVKGQISRLRQGFDGQAKLIFIEKMRNEGKGAALKAGFRKATGDILMVQDADLEYSVKDYPKLLAPLLNDRTKVVYGSRNLKRENYKNRYSYFSFYLGGMLLTWIVNMLYGLRLTDHPTGYKLFSSSLLKYLLQPKERRFSYEVAITACLAKAHVPFIEVPIHYRPRTMKEGKKINALDFVKSVIVAIKYKYGNERI